MTFCFICSSLEPGKDGVGDYTRKMAGEIIRQGHSAIIIALHDAYIENAGSTTQFDAETAINTLRVPKSLPYIHNKIIVEQFIQSVNPDVFSLQFVPYGFQDKGLPFKLGKFLKSISGDKTWHIMFHELWVGESKGESIKSRILGIAQQQIIKSLIQTLNTKLINTSIELYQKILSIKLNIKADVLPLFSNISNHKEELNIFNNKDLAHIIQNKEAYFIILNFGSYYFNSWDITSFVTTYNQQIKAQQKQLILVSIGGLSDEAKNNWLQLSKITGENTVFALGKCTETEITYWIKNLADWGIVTTPSYILGKSGSYAAFRALNLPVLIKDGTPNFISKRLNDIKLKAPLANYAFNNSDLTITPIPSVESYIHIPLKQIVETFLNQFK